MSSTKKEFEIFIYFLPPYSSQSNECTSVKLIRKGLAVEVNHKSLKDFSGVVLYPYASKYLSQSDSQRAAEQGLLIVDGPWEKLDSITTSVTHAVLRKLPEELEVRNPYYRKDNPLYFHSSFRFSSAEAISYALLIMGEPYRAEVIARAGEFLDAYRENEKYFA